MTGPGPMRGPGLYIHLGRHTHPWAPQYGYWLSEPYAELRCAAGCTHHASGAAAVARFVQRHADLHCPGTT